MMGNSDNETSKDSKDVDPAAMGEKDVLPPRSSFVSVTNDNRKKHKRSQSQGDPSLSCNYLKKDHVVIRMGKLTKTVSYSDSDEKLAIKLDNAKKHYGKGKSKLPVLMGLDMRVQRGTIYGLLGPSGCGKTTLLKCIVGKLKLDSGSVMVFGEPPGTPECGVPGPRVGYMPQELALFGEFNIAETLRYFSRLFGMSYQKYKERIDFLMKFLDLPSRTRMLQKMSGGQQRRASLAVALLHQPELLILDEPTVGVDPLLRASIWSHLIDLSNGSMSCSEDKPVACNGANDSFPFGGTTIVITTHYIEEARQAHRVGMMRFGKLLAEGAPDRLLQRYEKPNLEDVFLELCLQDGDVETANVREQRDLRPSICKSKKNGNSGRNVPAEDDSARGGFKGSSAHNSLLSDGDRPKVQVVETSKEPAKAASLGNRSERVGRCSQGMTICNLNLMKVYACMIKTFNRMKKRVGFLIYQFILPAIQVSLFCLAIGQDPKGLPVAIVSKELPGAAPCTNDSFSLECPIDFSGFIMSSNEHLANLTCRYMNFVDRDIAKQVYFDTYDEARQAVEDGEAWGVIHFGKTFSNDLYERIIEMSSDDLTKVDDGLINGSSIKIAMDVTNQHIAFTLQLKFVEAFDQFMRQLVASCNLPEAIASVPLLFEEPIYGSHDLTFTDFMAPGIILTIVHSMALGYSAMIIIIERNEGLLDRTWVAGVTPGEFALAHFIVSLGVNLLQVIVTLVFMILVFQVPAEGSMLWIFLLTMLQGICGTTIGLIISAVCDTQQGATQIALGIFYPNLILSGIIWPVESMPVALRYFSYILPQTFACEAMRGILLRGWGIAYMPVWRGFLVTMIWIVGTYAILKRLVMKET